ncbi:MAG: hypothetical protein V2I50_06120, partial [Desulfuromusa sp.]|nr:hypothetical protein [Desulfuromusa sp.]
MNRYLKYFLFILLGAPLLGAALLVGAYFYVSTTLPKVETLSDYRPPLITRIYADDATIIAEYSRERRILVPFEK